MKQWFSALGLKSKEEPVQEPLPDAEASSSLALKVLYDQLRHQRKYHVLDLGPALGANVDFFSQFSCKMYIEDFYRTLSSFDYLSEDELSYQAVFEYLLPYEKNTRFDIILGWDLFNYLERDEMHALILHLGHFCHKGTLLFALISTSQYLPDKPTTFQIVNHDRLLYQTNSTVLRPCPKYQQTDLNQLIPHFRVSNSFLLRNGFKEYLFSCE